MTSVALYARVSSERQAQTNTIQSQIDAIKSRIMADGLTVLEENQFIDNGYSGSNLVRPALEKLRDQIAARTIDKLYILSPDRFSRKYAYQMILIEEFEKFGVEIIFLNFQSDNNPESQLLLQMQGMIAEYERSKIMDRHRRGRIHTAKNGSINALASAPYGYRYINKHVNGGQASFEVIEAEADIIRKIFNWIGRERLTINQVSKKLLKDHIATKKGKLYWNRRTISYMLKNPAYKGQAAFGRSKRGIKLPRIRTMKGSSEQPKNNFSIYTSEKENWIYIPVPAIVDEDIFDAVQEQLKENKKIARVKQQGATYLLQGLLMCKQCGRAYCGCKHIKYTKTKGDRIYQYYKCTGTDSTSFGGIKMCNNKQIGINLIESIVWEEVKKLLKHPQRIFNEYQRRLMETEQSPLDQANASVEKQKLKMEKSISLLIDSYTHEYITKDEFEPRIKAMRQNLKIIQEQQKKLGEQKNLVQGIELVINNLENFANGINSKLDTLDWHAQ